MKKILAFSLSAVLLLGACKKSFLDEKPRAQTPEDYFASSTKAPEEIVTSVYSKLYDWNQHCFSWIGVTSIADDNADKGSEPGDSGTDKDQLDNYSFTSTSASFNEVWNANFEGIARVNKALDMLDKLNVDPNLKTRYQGEVRFLRAYYYFQLVRMFGGVPVISRVPLTEDEIRQVNVRNTAEEVYSLIEEDLQFASASLPENYLIEKGRATKWAAVGMLAKVQMYRQKWDDCASNCESLINSGLFELHPKYEEIWREVGEWSSESIWEIQAKGDYPAKGIQQYFSVQAPRGAGGLGWGFNTPTQKLYDAYEAGDVRRDATIITSGQVLWDGWQTNAAAPNKYYNYKCYISESQETFANNRDQTNKNLRVLRYADLLLIYAEALNEKGQTGAALQQLNAVRQRAKIGNSMAATQEEVRLAIWNERRLELAMEHDRLFDLRRTGQIADAIKADGKNFEAGKHELFPIPQRQIDLSNGLMIQNPGY